MSRLPGILLSLVFLATGSGAVAHAHRLEHASLHRHTRTGDDPGHGRVAAADRDSSAAASRVVAANSVVAADDDNADDGHGCETCVILSAPALPSVDPPPALQPGLTRLASVAPAARPVVARTPLRIDCRGPPIA